MRTRFSRGIVRFAKNSDVEKHVFFLFVSCLFLVFFMFFHMISDSLLLKGPGKRASSEKQLLVSKFFFSLIVLIFELFFSCCFMFLGRFFAARRSPGSGFSSGI